MTRLPLTHLGLPRLGLTRLTRTFAAAAAALSLAVPLPAQAQNVVRPAEEAQGNETGQLLIGLAVLGIAAHVLSRANHDRRDGDQANAGPRPAPVIDRGRGDGRPAGQGFPGQGHGNVNSPGGGFGNGNGNGHGLGHGGVNPGFAPGGPAITPATGAMLPRYCLRSYPTQTGNLMLLDGDCVSANYAFANRLPMTCAAAVQTGSGFASGFDVPCLRAEGYRLSAR
ncbi:hypothetical protein [Pseudoroseicyclus sp. CXY001]|uniref:hypothetical protein n=1 Tax=Pseudoroseicyclus sp. CXY001 TaxID=3242492 RepID=UPI0035712E0A